MQNILLAAIEQTRFCKTDFKDFDDDEKEAYFETWDNHKMSIVEGRLYNKLGELLGSNSLNILEIGSGTYRTTKALLKNVQNRCSYTSIDLTNPAPSFLSSNVSQKHLNGDFFNIPVSDIANNREVFNVVLIDIEPHGKEIDIYQKIRALTTKEHLCILKCVGFIDLLGDYYQRIFSDKYRASIVCSFSDPAPERSFSQVRDVFMVMTNSDV